MTFTKIQKTLFIFIVVLSVIFLIVYYYLGGFRKIEITTVPADTILIYGQHYEGKYDSDTLGNLIQKVSSYVRENSEVSQFAVVNFHEQESKKGNIQQFIGFTGKSETGFFPEDLQADTIDTKNSVRAIINMYFWVRPRPETIRQQLEEYAESHQLQTEPFTIERYLSDWEMWVDLPVAEKK